MRPGDENGIRAGSGRRAGPRALMIGLLAVASLACLAGCSDQRLSWLPYEFQATPKPFGVRPNERPQPGPSHLWADLDGDGFEELFGAAPAGFTCKKPTYPWPQVAWQHPLPAWLPEHEPPGMLCLDYDLEGDGRPDLVITAAGSLGLRWLTQVVDPSTGYVKAEFTLEIEDGRRRDGRWDGFLVPMGGVPGGVRGGGLVLFVVSVGFDVDGRGLWAVEPTTGEIVWQVETGPAPDYDSQLVDLDHDGRREIVIGGRGVDNRAGGRINGASDDSSHVMVFDDRGRSLWQHAMAAYPSGVQLAMADVDRDGVLDVIAAGGCHATDDGILRVYAGMTGELIGAREFESTVSDLLVEPGPDDTMRLVVCERLGGVGRYEVSRDGRIERLRRVVFDSEFSYAEFQRARVSGKPLLVGRLQDVGIAVLTPDLAVAAFLEYDDEHANRDPIKFWQLDAGAPILVSASHPGRSFVLRRARWPWYVGGATVLALAVPVGLAVRRRRRPIGAALERELGLRLLERLQTLRHENFGTLHNLSRLVWFCESALEDHLEPRPPSGQILQAVADTRETTLRRLEEIVALAGQANVREHRVASLADSGDTLRAVLARCRPDVPLDLAVLLQELRTIHQALQVESANVRADIEARFEADLPGAFAAVLRAQQLVLEESAVTARVQGEVVAPATWRPAGSHAVRCDGDDLCFMLDNLVGNAIRAMAGSRERELRLAWRADGLRTVVTVEDTGCGIPPEDWPRVLAGEASTRDGGGFGLKRTREILTLFRGSLDIVDSRPGRGTTFELRLPRVIEDPVASGATAATDGKRTA
ncbi:hypothetical protein GF314_08225 [bacterium]|nr:hypothetical protein [bacterium]